MNDLKGWNKCFCLSFIWIFNRCCQGFFFSLISKAYILPSSNLTIWPLRVEIELLVLIWIKRKCQKLIVICLSAIFKSARISSRTLLLAFDIYQSLDVPSHYNLAFFQAAIGERSSTAELLLILAHVDRSRDAAFAWGSVKPARASVKRDNLIYDIRLIFPRA